MLNLANVFFVRIFLGVYATDELRMAIKEVLCDNDKERHQYEEALIAITVDSSLKRLELLPFMTQESWSDLAILKMSQFKL